MLTEDANELRTERKKTRIPLNSIFFSGFTTILWCVMFPKKVEIIEALVEVFEVSQDSILAGLLI